MNQTKSIFVIVRLNIDLTITTIIVAVNDFDKHDFEII